jgi:3-methyladenine DNA glycosylase AlkD
MNAKQLHKELLEQIIAKSGKPTNHTFLDNYLGNSHPRYPINNPTLRSITKEFTSTHKELPVKEFQQLLTSLIEAPSCTEKMTAGLLLDTCTKEQRKFNPAIFDKWLNHLIGWVEVDTLCTGKYSKLEIVNHWPDWKKLLLKFASSKNIQKRRASLVLLCQPVRQLRDEAMCELALRNIQTLSHEKEVLITKAISWLLRSMVKHYKKEVAAFVRQNQSTLPSIAVRETLTKIKTGTKNPKQ